MYEATAERLDSSGPRARDPVALSPLVQTAGLVRVAHASGGPDRMHGTNGMQAPPASAQAGRVSVGNEHASTSPWHTP